jgi:hypothetical protein
LVFRQRKNHDYQWKLQWGMRVEPADEASRGGSATGRLDKFVLMGEAQLIPTLSGVGL